MRILALLILFSGVVSAGEITLLKGQAYTVPDGKVWIIENTPVSTCRVCTADVYVKGELNNIEAAGVIFSGEFNFSFSSNSNGPIRLFPGTKVTLGDSRGSLVVYEEEL
ncbi:hypothetical protein [uncultured Pseudoteredinibacter sp.]|uniref:hypothetical protein n=1 Tax=uncultured Pseudoteredinibacter sp. TaxID=1641701 RepID=UPI0026106352|nr:hypothetical protein [uncultured Pseudoteredinibacter sp.]